MKRTHEDAEKTRLAIIESAVTVFDKMGYSRAKISDICKLAKVTRGAFYWYFKNKEDILLCIAGTLYEETSDKLNFFYETGKTPQEKITNTIKGLCHWYIDNKSVRVKRKVLVNTFLNEEQTLSDKIFMAITNEKHSLSSTEMRDAIVDRTCRGYGIDITQEPEKKQEIYESFIAMSSFVDGLIGHLSKPFPELDKETVDNVIDRFIEGIFHSYKIYQEEK